MRNGNFRLRMENPKTSEWVTPKLVVKRRRKTTSARPEKIERTIDTGLEKENVNNPKFNPFQSKAKTARRQSTIGFGSIGIGSNISGFSNSVFFFQTLIKIPKKSMKNKKMVKASLWKPLVTLPVVQSQKDWKLKPHRRLWNSD